MKTPLKKVGENVHVFYGIIDCELFVQIATSGNKILFDSKVQISANPEPKDFLMALKSLLSDSYRNSDAKVSLFDFSECDGRRIKNDGEIEECIATRTFYPKFRNHLISSLCVN